ncbi:MAG TPA: response regulator transcription factor [Chitinophagales bacterium]|nr:response regulator transcription factor [Chitinophagales bacterium]
MPEILLVDDHALIRRGMKYVINSNFSGCSIDEAEDGKGMIEQLKSRHYTHLILDLQLPDCNVMNIFETIRNDFPDLPILIYTMSPEDIFGKRLLQMGAKGFLSKESNVKEVIKALNLFLLGRNYMSAEMEELMKMEPAISYSTQNPFDDLSAREVAVAHNLLRGIGVKEIAGELDLKSSTVATYKARIFDKIGVNNLMDLRNMAQMFHFST